MQICGSLTYQILSESVKGYMGYMKTFHFWLYHKVGFIMDQYGWKLQIPDKIWQKSPILNFNSICETVYGICGSTFMDYVDQAVF
jgi:hypothetical protein